MTSKLRTVPARTKIDFWIDVILAVGFVVAYNARFTGLVVHEWLGVAFGVLLIVHILLHGEWVGRVTTRVFSKDLTIRERLRWLVDLLMFITMTTAVATGIMISEVVLEQLGWEWLGDRNRTWRLLHARSSLWTIYLVALHLALNWNWIRTVTKRLVRR